jgi:hypothetical protein
VDTGSRSALSQQSIVIFVPSTKVFFHAPLEAVIGSFSGFIANPAGAGIEIIVDTIINLLMAL